MITDVGILYNIIIILLFLVCLLVLALKLVTDKLEQYAQEVDQSRFEIIVLTRKLNG